MIVEKGNPFFVRIDEVPKPGLRVQAELSAEWLASVLYAAYQPTGKGAKIEINLERDGDSLVVKGEITFEYAFGCSRCAVSVERESIVPVVALFTPAQRHRVHLADVEIEEGRMDGLFSYEARAFSIEEPFVETVVFSLDPYPLCTPECAGLCPQCGKSLNSQSCNCPEQNVDPRWAALPKLRETGST